MRVSRWVAFHGCSINISNNLKDYSKIKPCGLNNKKITSIYNESKKTNTKLVITGSDAPNNLNLREDVSSRLNWELVYQLKALTANEKKIALTKHAEANGIALDKKIIDYCMANLNRDLHYLIATIDALDEWSLKTKRPITIPLLKQLLV